MTSKSSTIQIIFLFQIIFVSAFSSTILKESTDVLTTASIASYTNLVQYVIPSPTTSFNCSYFQNQLAQFNYAYSEISSLSNYACLKQIFDAKVASLNQILSNGSCIKDTSSSSSGISTISGASANLSYSPAGNESVVVGITDTYVGYQNGSQGTRKGIDKGYYSPFFLDRMVTANGFNLLSILGNQGDNVPQFQGQVWYGIFTFMGTNLNEVQPMYAYNQKLVRMFTMDSSSWPNKGQTNFTYVRISTFDMTFWGLDNSGYVYQTPTANSLQDGVNPWVKDSSNIQLIDIDCSQKDGSVVGVKTDGTVWSASGLSKGWSQIGTLKANHVRVIANGNVFASGNDGNIYFLANYKSNWQALGGQSGFIWFDVNNLGLLTALKKADYRAWSTQYVSQQWTDEKMHFTTVKVQDSGNIVGIGTGAPGLTPLNSYYLTKYNVWEKMLTSFWLLGGPQNSGCTNHRTMETEGGTFCPPKY